MNTKKGQLSTSYGLTLLLLQASLNPTIVKIWKKEKHIVKILGDNTRKSEIKSTVGFIKKFKCPVIC
ncbi:hypothetical protein HMPREF3215_02040 [Staphylococcus simulans]|nr:hypothetical protein HMPREF3215_02040 [Staphylococcus simulans]